MKILLALILSLTAFQAFAQDHTSQIFAYRKQYKQDFLDDKHSPLKEADLANLRFYDADSTYRVNAVVELTPTETPFQMPTFNGAKQQYVRYAVAKFTLKGKPLQLSVYSSLALANRPGFSDYLFLPFTDETNGDTTYGGGRYIDLKTTDIKNGHLIIDFNKAYNPYCAYSDGYQCPMPPRENDLALKIEAGEKKFADDKKH